VVIDSINMQTTLVEYCIKNAEYMHLVLCSFVHDWLSVLETDGRLLCCICCFVNV